MPDLAAALRDLLSITVFPGVRDEARWKQAVAAARKALAEHERTK